ncbi:hypothetical protein AABD55_08140 [Edwardsiella piscicida]|uniref:hypothetical protein n=1 Tax=Edwardsiella piscicida TaxID=1263550 RepID=UPI00370CFEB4
MREALLSAAIRFCRVSLVSRETLQFGASPAGASLSLAPAERTLAFSRVLSVTSWQPPDIGSALWPGVDFTVEADQLHLLCPAAALRVRIATEPVPGIGTGQKADALSGFNDIAGAAQSRAASDAYTHINDRLALGGAVGTGIGIATRSYGAPEKKDA